MMGFEPSSAMKAVWFNKAHAFSIGAIGSYALYSRILVLYFS
jgi:hypothetical protein